MSDLEYCCDCGNETGHAGPSDDSRYLESGRGPLCDCCWNAGRVTELEADVGRLQTLAEKLEFERGMWKRTAEAAESKLRAVEGLPRYDIESPPGTGGLVLNKRKDGFLIRYDELEAALKGNQP